MCATCGCANGESDVHIEGDHHHPLPGALPFAAGTIRRLAVKRASPLAAGGAKSAIGNQAGLSNNVGLNNNALPDNNPSMLPEIADSRRRIVSLEQDILAKNDLVALKNRACFAAKSQLVLNLVSSPGSGKTTLLTETLKRLQNKTPCAVIEGDQQTANDAERIRATGTPAIQINTGTGCHLDAQMVSQAMSRLPLAERGILFIENVGNLVCPASFDLGERHKVVVLSVTEGEDKPLKYPHMFAASSLMLLNKVDLLPHLTFDVAKCVACARQINPGIDIILTSATTGEGLEHWLAWLELKLCV